MIRHAPIINYQNIIILKHNIIIVDPTNFCSPTFYAHVHYKHYVFELYLRILVRILNINLELFFTVPILSSPLKLSIISRFSIAPLSLPFLPSVTLSLNLTLMLTHCVTYSLSPSLGEHKCPQTHSLLSLPSISFSSTLSLSISLFHFLPCFLTYSPLSTNKQDKTLVFYEEQWLWYHTPWRVVHKLTFGKFVLTRFLFLLSSNESVEFCTCIVRENSKWRYESKKTLKKNLGCRLLNTIIILWHAHNYFQLVAFSCFCKLVNLCLFP